MDHKSEKKKERKKANASLYSIRPLSIANAHPQQKVEASNFVG